MIRKWKNRDRRCEEVDKEVKVKRLQRELYGRSEEYDLEELGTVEDVLEEISRISLHGCEMTKRSEEWEQHGGMKS